MMREISKAIHDVLQIAAGLRLREEALRDAVQSGDEDAILAAAREMFGGDGADRRDRAPARLQRRPGGR